MLFRRKSKFALGKTQLVAALLSVLLVLAMFGQFALPKKAEATSYTSYEMYTLSTGGGGAASAFGCNVSQGFETTLPWYWGIVIEGSHSYYALYVWVPNDGSTWYVCASDVSGGNGTGTVS